jgi:hypothetical protein
LQQNLAKSSYGSSPLWLHHKIDQKNIDCKCALNLNIVVASDANDMDVIAVPNPKIGDISYGCMYKKKQQDLDCWLSMIWELGVLKFWRITLLSGVETHL